MQVRIFVPKNNRYIVIRLLLLLSDIIVVETIFSLMKIVKGMFIKGA